MFKDFLLILGSFLGMFTLTVNAFFWAAGLLFIAIIIRLVFDLLIAVKQCAGEHNYVNHSDRR